MCRGLPQKGAFVMRTFNEGPRHSSTLGYLTVMLVVVSAKIDVITADVICIGLAAYMMWAHQREGRE